MSKLEMSPEILDALQKLSSLLESEDAFERTLDTVVRLSVSVIPGCDSAGVTLRSDGKNLTAAASDPYTLEIDKIQYDSDEGPCLAAINDAEPKKIDSVDDETRWPEFCRRAAEKGFRSSFSFPLGVDGSPGALNLYARSDASFDEPAVQVAEIFGRQAGIALENARIYRAARKLGEQLNEALNTRDVIGQAKGILMEREGISDADAFEMLRTASQSSNVKLREVAQRVIEGSSCG